MTKINKLVKIIAEGVPPGKRGAAQIRYTGVMDRETPWLDPLRPAYWAARRAGRRLRGAARRLLPADAAKITAVPKFFILSTGRTGTMWLAHFFDAHSANVRAFHEPYPPLLGLGLAAARGEVTAVAAARQIAAQRRWYLGRLDRPIYLEANNRLFALAPALQLAWPGVTIIHVVRDGRAVVRSGLARGWYGPDDRFPRLAATDFADDPWREAWAGWGALEKNAWLWQKHNAVIRAGAAAQPNYHLFQFEALFDAGDDTAVRELMHLVDPQMQPGAAELAAARARPANARPAPGGEEGWTAAQEAAFRQIAGAEMARYGYAP